jgi:hypothetical protein
MLAANFVERDGIILGHGWILLDVPPASLLDCFRYTLESLTRLLCN